MSDPGDHAPGPAGLDSAIDPTLPEPVRRALAAGAPLERIVLDAEGRWLHEGEPIENDRVRRLFHRSINRTPGGTWVLRIPPFTYPITVEDTPYHVRSLRLSGSGPGERVILLLSDESEEVLEPSTLRLSGTRLLCAVKEGAHRARFNRPAYYALLDRLEHGDGPPRLRLAGRLWDLALEASNANM